jgi:hypothetical protein
VRETKVAAPVTTTDGDDAELGNDDGGTDGSGDFLGGLDAETDVTLGVTNDDNGLETGTLTGTGLLLDRLDLLRGKKPKLALCCFAQNGHYSMHYALIPATHPPRQMSISYLHDLILELGQEVVNNLVLLDGQRVQVNLLHAVDLASLDETAELGDGLPLLLLALTTTASTAASATTATVTTARTETTATSGGTAG